MKKRIFAILSLVLVFCLSFALTSCGNECPHDFENACDPDCAECGWERTTGHLWKDADCYNPKTCRTCGVIEGEALGCTHNYHDPCHDEVLCVECLVLHDKPIEHEFDENGRCVICGEYGAVTTEVE